MERSLSRTSALLLGAADKIRGLGGWRRALAAFGAGLCGALAMAPFYFLPLLAVAFTVLILLIDKSASDARPLRAAFSAGWFFGFGYFLAGVYWMAFSFFVQAEQFAWMAPFAITAMPAGLALFTGGAALAAAAFWQKSWARIFLFAAVFALFEYARGHILTGLPWNLTGQALAGAAVSAQTAAWWGAYGLSVIALLLAAAPAAGLEPGASVKKALLGIAVMLSGTILLYVLGFVRLIDPDVPPVKPDAHVRIVQPNIAQRDKINPDKWGENFYRSLDRSKEAAPDGAPLFIIWPENAAPLLGEAQSALNVLSTELPEDSVLISGAVRRERSGTKDDYFNSILVVSQTPNGRKATAFYDKHHLVPFGEYLPFYDVLNAIGLAQLTPYGDAGFAAGEGPQVLTAGGLSFAPLICYEAIFPGALYPKGERPRWLVTVTNDAWFGDTSGPRQHLDQARLRSIESGLPMARSANTGVSALIDAKGRIIERVNLYNAGVIDAPMPRALPRTLYDRAGDVPFFLMVAGLLTLGFRRRLFLRAGKDGLQPLRDTEKS
jgi:apolipoprotein N-acyltransferase